MNIQIIEKRGEMQMKFVSFEKNNEASFGVATDEGIIDLKNAYDGKYADLKAFLENEDVNNWEAPTTKVDYALDEISYLPVIPNPTKILCVGLNYHAHVEEVGTEVADYPTIFMRVPDSQL